MAPRKKYSQLTYLKSKLNKVESSLAVFHGTPKDIFRDLCDTYNISEVFTNHDYEPYAIARDKEISEFLDSEGIAFNTFKDQVIFERAEITKDDGTPYKVYTPYSKKWFLIFFHYAFQCLS